MKISRRKFITTTGAFAAGTGLLMLDACHINKKPDIQRLRLDYAGPHLFYEDFRLLCKGVKGVEIIESGFEQSVMSSSPLAFLAEPLGNRGVKLLMLLEQGKDVLVLPPLTRDYDEFNAIQLQCNMMDRRLALLNPFRYFSSVQELKRLISTGATGRISSLEISIDPVYNIPFLAPVEGITGPALLLITMINEILASFPLSVMASLSATPSGISDMQLKSLAFDYQNMILNCHFIPGMSGWTLKATCEKDTLELRDSGELHSGNEGLMIKADRQVMLNGLRTGIEDFIQSVRERTEPESNSVEGLMQITINHAIERAITQGVKTDFVDRPYYVEADKVWMKENRI